MRLRVAFVGCLLAGCGSISDNGNNIDAAIVTDTTAPMMMSSNPANMAGKVSVLSPVSVFFDEDLDESSVTAANVKLTYLQRLPLQPYLLYQDFYWSGVTFPGAWSQQPIPGTVSYDSKARKVSFVPNAPMPYGVVVRLSFNGVKDTAGNMFDGDPVKFMTFTNIESRRFTFTGAGQPTTWFDFVPDMNGRPTRETFHTSAGVDGQWHTSDDNVSNNYVFNFMADGRIVDERNMFPGPDGKYDTADDIPSYMFKYTYDANGALTERVYNPGPGLDGMWNTNDDVINVLSAVQYEDGRPAFKIDFNDAGSDTVWRSGDERCDLFYEYQYDALGRRSRDIEKLCGADSLPKTPDDQISVYREYTYDSNGLLTAIAYRTAIGGDGMWFTVDDVGGSQTKIERDAKGLATRTANLLIGPDNRWNTADDDIQSYVATAYTEKGLSVGDTSFNGKGPDGTWGTADDVISSYTKVTYDENGNRIESKTANNAGPDAMWMTGDDRISTQSQFDTAH